MDIKTLCGIKKSNTIPNMYDYITHNISLLELFQNIYSIIDYAYNWNLQQGCKSFHMISI